MNFKSSGVKLLTQLKRWQWNYLFLLTREIDCSHYSIIRMQVLHIYALRRAEL